MAMTKSSSTKQPALTILIIASFLLLTGAQSAAAQSAQTVWAVCTFDTSSVSKVNNREKFERRLYVSNLISLSKEEYFALTKNDQIESACGDYLDKTVNQAAAERGEKLDPGGTLKVIKNIELSGEDIGSPNPYTYGPKEAIEKKLADDIKEAKNFNRVIYSFNWDPTGKNEAADLANEMKRTQPTIGPTPPAKASKPTP